MNIYFYAKYISKHHSLMTQLFSFINWSFFNFFIKMVVNSNFHGCWHCVIIPVQNWRVEHCAFRSSTSSFARSAHPFARPLARLLAMLTHSLFPNWLLRLWALLRCSFRLLAHTIAPEHICLCIEPVNFIQILPNAQWRDAITVQSIILLSLTRENCTAPHQNALLPAVVLVSNPM